MSGVSRWIQSILRSITGTKFGSWNSTFYSSLDHSANKKYVAYVQSLGKIILCMFALDHYHYAHWMTIHVRDIALKIKCPATHAEFLNGNFVTQKTMHKFSALAHDQVQEELNTMVKGDGGVIGITENEASLRW